MEQNENVKPDETAGARESAGRDFGEIVQAAKELRFRNPELAAKAVAGEEDFLAALKGLASSEPYMVWPKVNTGNPEVERSAPTLADRLRKALKTRGRRG
ncbi:MAG: hypothetical protein Kow00107_01050 [Planctomycetota bacterium]